jgi:hypothetical protein
MFHEDVFLLIAIRTFSLGFPSTSSIVQKSKRITPEKIWERAKTGASLCAFARATDILEITNEISLKDYVKRYI